MRIRYFDYFFSLLCLVNIHLLLRTSPDIIATYHVHMVLPGGENSMWWLAASSFLFSR